MVVASGERFSNGINRVLKLGLSHELLGGASTRMQDGRVVTAAEVFSYGFETRASYCASKEHGDAARPHQRAPS